MLQSTQRTPIETIAISPLPSATRREPKRDAAYKREKPGCVAAAEDAHVLHQLHHYHT